MKAQTKKSVSATNTALLSKTKHTTETKHRESVKSDILLPHVFALSKHTQSSDLTRLRVCLHQL